MAAEGHESNPIIYTESNSISQVMSDIGGKSIMQKTIYSRNKYRSPLSTHQITDDSINYGMLTGNGLKKNFESNKQA